MAFNQSEVDKLLAKCQRRCCVCHKFCGVKMELHHITWRSKSGNDDIINAIPLCFECHAEVNHYNPEHPKGRKFTKGELLEHKRLWLEICEKHPEALIAAPRRADIGPLEGMLLELEHNKLVVDQMVSNWRENIGSALHENEYLRAVKEGSLMLLSDDLRAQINSAYARVSQIKTLVRMFSNTRPEGNAFAEAINRLLAAFRRSSIEITSAFTQLKNFLSREGGDNNGQIS